MTTVDTGEPASEQEVKDTKPPSVEADNSGETSETTVTTEPSTGGGAQMPDNVNFIKNKDGCPSG